VAYALPAPQNIPLEYRKGRKHLPHSSLSSQGGGMVFRNRACRPAGIGAPALGTGCRFHRCDRAWARGSPVVLEGLPTLVQSKMHGSEMASATVQLTAVVPGRRSGDSVWRATLGVAG